MAVAVSVMPGMAAAPRLTSCRTLIAFLDEDDHALKSFALENLVLVLSQTIPGILKSAKTT